MSTMLPFGIKNSNIFWHLTNAQKFKTAENLSKLVKIGTLSQIKLYLRILLYELQVSFVHFRLTLSRWIFSERWPAVIWPKKSFNCNNILINLTRFRTTENEKIVNILFKSQTFFIKGAKSQKVFHKDKRTYYSPTYV